ncbi:hypothetical protein AVEN_14051-1 [Araneus ventricosus]|uniref:Uncharacterized protein n=1 Tax=Araneus ventricosus TaxID=182803 RepID=A0A4Y2PJW8_ARAVE|nr:hypothetical protein AVEN_14051-1 [Araneus ventricosus]
MEKKLKCVLLLSLKEMALRRVAVFFWSDTDILASISKFRLHEFPTEDSKKEWLEKIDNKIKDKMLKLELPKSLTKQMIDIVRPIGLEIRRWKKFHQDFFHEGLFQSSEEICLPASAKLCWTTAGRIDNKKTAEELVCCGGLDLRNRYELACLYCLEDDIPLLWAELPEEQKEYFCLDDELLPDLHFCWPHVFKGELTRLDHLLRGRGKNLTTFNQWAFEDSVERGNKIAAEYFFQKLTHEEREASLMRSVHSVLADSEEVYCLAERLTDVLCYLLSLMTPEQQMETIRAHPVNLLLCFLHWPWQDLLLENAGLIWTFLPPRGYDDLLQKMTDIFRRYFPISFREFFVQSPLDFKKYFVESHFGFINACRFLSLFFRYEDSESIEVMFRNVDSADKVKLVFHSDVLQLFYKSILRDRWHMVAVCLREAALSKEDRERLKDTFTGFFERSGNGECVNRKFKRFFEFLDETDASADKLKESSET